MQVQFTFGTMCRQFISQLRPIVLNYLKENFEDGVSPDLIFRDRVLTDGSREKWFTRCRFDDARGDEIIDFGSIRDLFDEDFGFLEDFGIDRNKFIRCYNHAWWVRCRNAHMASITKEDCQTAIEDLKYMASCFDIDLSSMSDSQIIYGNDFKQGECNKDLEAYGNNSKLYEKVLVWTSLLLEDFRVVVLDFYLQHGRNIKDIVEGYLLVKNNSALDFIQVYNEDAADFIDFPFVRSFIERYKQELKEMYHWDCDDIFAVDDILYYFNQIVLTNRNLVHHQASISPDGLDSLESYIKDFYNLFRMDYNRMRHQAQAFINFSPRQ